MNGRISLLTAIMALGIVTTAPAQAPAASPPAPWVAPAVGSVAPDFALTGATQYGVLREPVRLSNFRGKTVVLAYFYKARTKG